MFKGKIKKQKKYLSVAIIPHSLDKIKVLKFKALYSKIIAVCVLICIIFISAGFFTYSALKENTDLKKNEDSLLNLSSEQKKLLEDKAQEIKQLQDIEKSYDKKIEDFTNKYNDMAQKYLTSRGDAIRSGKPTSNSASIFINDAKELKNILTDLEQLNISRGINEANLTDTQKKLDEYLDSMPTTWPTSGRISSPFGGRPDPFNDSSRFHTGLDIAAPVGRNIVAAGSGTVITAGRTSVYGNTVIIDHGHGITTKYGHTSKILVKKGQKVKKGDIIARVGSTGRSTGPHLHFEVSINGTPVDPLKYLESK
ncbi:MAG: M23 family metallopeptidase [Bacillota bacterium]|nr:M23 family metallopeptidase [Bacillota bacterium]